MWILFISRRLLFWMWNWHTRSKRTKTADLEALDAADFMNPQAPHSVDCARRLRKRIGDALFLLDKKMRWKHGRKKPPHKSVVYISEQNLSKLHFWFREWFNPTAQPLKDNLCGLLLCLGEQLWSVWTKTGCRLSKFHRVFGKR